MSIQADPRHADLLRQMRPLVRGRADATMALARQFAAAGEECSAVELANAALDLAPGDGEVRALSGELLAQTVPDWHFVITRDHIRNQAYADALARAIGTPDTVSDCLVLEIGTGTGILAMMAAQRGARVVTCEANPAIAAAARAVIAANGLSERITVVNRHSTALDIETDLGRPADILVSEIVSNDLLSECVLPAHADAATRLLKPDARVIPARGRVRIALAHDRDGGRRGMPTDAGFDLSAFDRLARAHYEIGARNPRLALRGAPADLFTFAFDGSQPATDGRTIVELRSDGGDVNGIVQWIALDLDDEAQYENRPGAEQASCWAPLFWPLAEPIATAQGETVKVGAYHTQERVRLWRIAQ